MWTIDSLTNRPQHVRLGDCVSDVVAGSGGAPQGTVLSPLQGGCGLNRLHMDTSKTQEVVTDINRKVPLVTLVNIQSLDIEIVGKNKYLGVLLNS